MATATVARHMSARADAPLRPSGAPLPATVVRADRADARWTVRVVLEAGPAMAAVRSVRAIAFDRDTGAGILHTVWTDWHAVPLLVAHLPPAPPTEASLEAAAAHLADALLALLGRNAAVALAALHAGDVPAPVPGMSRRERQYRHIVRDAASRDPRTAGGTVPAGRSDLGAAEAAHRARNGRLSGEADRARGDS